MKEQNANDKLYCPFCGGTHLITNQKGFGAGKAFTGALLTGGIGLLAGFIGSKKIKVTCMSCKETFGIEAVQTTPPSKADKERFLRARYPERYETKEQKAFVNMVMMILTIIFLPIIIIKCG